MRACDGVLSLIGPRRTAADGRTGRPLYVFGESGLGRCRRLFVCRSVRGRTGRFRVTSVPLARWRVCPSAQGRSEAFIVLGAEWSAKIRGSAGARFYASVHADTASVSASVSASGMLGQSSQTMVCSIPEWGSGLVACSLVLNRWRGGAEGTGGKQVEELEIGTT
jgi:hypothetical protein